MFICINIKRLIKREFIDNIIKRSIKRREKSVIISRLNNRDNF